MLEKARSRKAILASRIEGLVAQHRLVKASAVGSKVHFDDSKLARAKELISTIRTDLDVAAKLFSADVDFHGEIPLDEAATEDIGERVAAYLGLDGPEAGNLADVSYAHE